MNKENHSVATQKIPQTKNVWLRFIKYFVSAMIISSFLYWGMSQMELDYLRSLDNHRSAIFLVMLNIMTAEAWGWFSFLAIILSALWGDWHNFRWQSFPKEKSSINEK